MTVHAITGSDGDHTKLGHISLSSGEGKQYQPQKVVAIQDSPMQKCSPSEATFSDFSKGISKFSYVKLRHKMFGR